jgi:hypothetical protein
MLLKVTLKFPIYCVIFFFCGCAQNEKGEQELETQRIQYLVAEARINAAY